MDYKQTINLPQTGFPMKASLSSREPQMLGQWEKLDVYGQLRQRSKGRKLFILHDGPPYANGHIHIGHALNKILKDIIVRYKSMAGFDAPYIPGWDCHGLPVEHQLFRDLHKTKDQIERLAFRKLAFDYAMKFVGIQREEFKRLGIISDWEHPYLTVDQNYEQAILTSFIKLVEKGYVYRGLKPVNWCFRCETALAEAEVEYADRESDSIFVKFELRDHERARKLGIKFDKECFILIWTTTPWTLLANVAVALHPGLDYLLVEAQGQRYIVAKDLFHSSLKEKLGFGNETILAEWQGKDLEGLEYAHPLCPREGRVVLADYVSKEEGTGCVHTAPGHGQEDFMTGLAYKLDVLMPVDERGRFDDTAGDFKGLAVFAANEKIIQRLQDLKRLVLNTKYPHTYPHCWRCKSPIIFRATEQWFLSVDHNGLRKKLLSVIQRDVDWIPASGRERIAAMVENRPDWCLSRQRYWGVPIPAVVCNACRRHILDVRVMKAFAEKISGSGTDAWFSIDAKEFLPQDLRCPCGGREFHRSTDILDVWFDSGVSHQAVLKGKKGLKLPADLYLEGSDQHRGWFQASLIPSMAIDDKPPFEAVLTHGFVVDGQGRKMSKSLGNVISPQEIIKECGADILRLWVMASDYKEDVRISKEIMAALVDAYRKIRNTVRYLLGNLSDFVPDKDRVRTKDLFEIDRWALWKLGQLVDDVTKGYDTYAFYQVFQTIYKFCNEDMSSLYLDILKDRLYTSAKGAKARRSAQTVLYEILSALTRLIAPVLVFTAEEIYQMSPGEGSMKEQSVHWTPWPRIDATNRVSEQEVKGIDEVLKFRPAVLKALEGKRAKGEIGSSLEAKVVLSVKSEQSYRLLASYQKQLSSVFIVSEVLVAMDKQIKGAVAIDVQRAEGKKCVRCWNYATDVDADAQYAGLCGRCVEAVKACSQK
ncbi:MAG: isoleucine--tRNA ligase [Candidatus Omnitrophota bacterium]